MNDEIIFSQNILGAIGTDKIYVLIGLTIASILSWTLLIRYKYDYVKRYFVLGLLLLIVSIPFVWSAKIQTILVNSLVAWIFVLFVATFDVLTFKSEFARKALGIKIRDDKKLFDETIGLVGFTLILTSLSVITLTLNYSIAFSQEKQKTDALLFWKHEITQTDRLILTFYDGESTTDFRLPIEHSPKFEENNCYSLTYYPSPFLEVESRLNMFITEIAQITPCTISLEGN